MVDGRVLLLADVTMLEVARLLVFDLFGLDITRLESLGRKDIRRGEHRPPSQRPYPRSMEHRLFAPGFCRSPLALSSLYPPSARDGIGVVDPGYGQVQTLPVFPRKPIQQQPVGSD